jgi:hypothetical protein
VVRKKRREPIIIGAVITKAFWRVMPSRIPIGHMMIPTDAKSLNESSAVLIRGSIATPILAMKNHTTHAPRNKRESGFIYPPNVK